MRSIVIRRSSLAAALACALGLGSTLAFLSPTSRAVALELGEEPPARQAHASAVAPAAAPAVVWSGLMEGNRRFVRGSLEPRAVVGLRERLVQGQQPQTIVLGCADSRVPPEMVFDRTLGELFVVRTAGNIADAVALGSLEYAVEHLRSPLIVVLGHEKCGAVAAAATGEAMPSLNLDAIVQRIRPALTDVGTGLQPDERSLAQVEANVHRSAKNLLAESTILRHAVEAGRVTVLKAVYRLGTGEVHRVR